MTPDQTIDLLTIAAAFDQRTVGEGDAMAWHSVVGDLNYADCETAVLAHYRETRERIMPSDVRARVKAIRDQRLQDTEIPTGPLVALMDDPPAYLAAVRAANAAIADGRDPETAMRAVTRTARRELEAR